MNDSPAPKPDTYSPGYPQIYKSTSVSIRNYSMSSTTTQYSSDSSVKISTYVNHHTGATRMDTVIKGGNTDTTLSPVLLNF